jgi:hypothetical protein
VAQKQHAHRVGGRLPAEPQRHCAEKTRAMSRCGAG